MKLNAKQIQNVTVVSIVGDLDAQSGPELAQFFKLEKLVSCVFQV
jgi:anti-anti-sigma regulatory factor